jgi:hypothetical protein
MIGNIPDDGRIVTITQNMKKMAEFHFGAQK